MSNNPKWNRSVPFPRDNFILRCIEESFGPSKSSGKPMISLEFEVVSPDDGVSSDGKRYTVVGEKIVKYYVTKSIDADGNVDGEKTKSLNERLEKLYTAFGLDFAGFNPDNPTLGFKGKTVWACLYSDSQEQRKAATPEQIAAGQRVGDILVDPITNKPRLSFKAEIETIYGLAPTDASKPY